MPHVTFEYSANAAIDFQSFFSDLTEQLVATGAVKRLGVKCRAVKSEAHFIVDGKPNYKMVNLLLRLREGRTLETKQELSQIGMRLMEKYFEQEIARKEIILSTEIKELIKGLDLIKNSIR
tara:strand:+ start:6084 stop:6446 length:363 start_codon:yes stop_codon:yes gene_type:complete